MGIVCGCNVWLGSGSPHDISIDVTRRLVGHVMSVIPPEMEGAWSINMKNTFFAGSKNDFPKVSPTNCSLWSQTRENKFILKKYFDLRDQFSKQDFVPISASETRQVYISFISQHTTSKAQGYGQYIKLKGGSSTESSSKRQKTADHYFIIDKACKILILELHSTKFSDFHQILGSYLH